MPLSKINNNRPSLWLQKRSLPNPALIAVGKGLAFLPFISSKNGLRCFAADISKAKRQLVLTGAQPREISNGRFDYNLSIMTERACLEMFWFNQTVLWKSLHFYRGQKPRKEQPKTATEKIMLAGCVVLACLPILSHWCNKKHLFGKFAPYLSEIFRETLKHFIDAHGDFVLDDILQGFFNANAERFVKRM